MLKSKGMFTRKFYLFLIVVISFLILLVSAIYLMVPSLVGINNVEDSELDYFSYLTDSINVSTSKNDKCLVNANIQFNKFNQPATPKNNKYGLYIYAENKEFMKKAAELVNSNGGEWGYVLIPYNIKDRDSSRWRGVFERLYSYKLIPVIQLWDVDPKNYKKDTDNAAKFLNKFDWPIKQRYISVYNEVNDARFWKENIDPKNYAEVLNYTIDSFKKENSDFFIMNGAFNTSAPTTKGYLDAFEYKKIMNSHVPGIFEKLDGWASHPYPMPNFAGSPYDTGRWSIKAYEDELIFLKNELGVKKDLPVFITETGWAHAEGKTYNAGFLPVKKVAENFKIAYEEVWLKDSKVVAVMPFTISFEAPFDHFSWVNQDYVPYYHFDFIKQLPKIKGEPEYLIKESEKSIGC